MSKEISPLVLGLGAVGLYLLLKPATPVVQVPGQPPVTSTNPLTNLLPGLTTLLPGSTVSPVATVPVTYGINSGIRGGNGSFYTCANYAQLLTYDPNLGNPNYRMTQDQITIYLANYSDLQTGLPAWVGHKQSDNSMPPTLSAAALEHWKLYGCAEKRIYYPLQPPSTAAFIPPPKNTQSSGGGSSWIGTAIQVAGSVAIALIGVDDRMTAQLSDAEINMLVTGSAIVKKILPFYLQVAPTLVASINNKVDDLVSMYSN